MELFGKNISKSNLINPNIRVLLLPIITLFVMIILVIFVTRIALPRITIEMEKLDQVKDNVARLEQKLEILRQVQDNILDYADTSLVALPDEDPVLWKLGQVKTIANENEITIINRGVKLGEASSAGLHGTGISITSGGEFSKSFDFVNDIINSSPISNVGLVGIKKGSDGIVVEFTINTYNAPLPTKLPKISEPIKNLTVSEQALLDKLAKLKRPEFTVLDPTGPFNRQDPFN